jgi:hypothetical protein
LTAAAARAVPTDRALALLASGELTVEGRLPWSSNATFLVRVADAQGQLLAVYKPRRGERPLWDFPAGTLCRREVAAYVVSEALGWRLVPPTVLRDGPYGPGMLQAFIPHDPDQHYLVLVDPDPLTIRRLVAFDLVINNADRKSGHVLVADDGTLWAIDHGVCFHLEPKLRTVIWDHAGEALPAGLAADLERLAGQLAGPAAPRTPPKAGAPAGALAELLAPEEVAATARRARRLARHGRFPAADPARRSTPWPPV